MDATNRSVVRVLMFPWLAYSHIHPFLELAKKLSERNFYIHLCSSPANLGHIKENLLEMNFPSIQLVELHLPSSPDLPPHYHTTKGLPNHLLGNLMQAFDTASSSFSSILTTLRPYFLTCDFFQPWAPALALSLNIPTVQFVVSGNKANSVAAHAFKKSEDDKKTEITEWLNKRDPCSSVIYVAFGSENYLSKEDREELALGLLLSNVNFIWVLRFPRGEEISAREALPEGFIEMVSERGLIVEEWAPQKRILSHPSIGGFLSHCGWGSVLESMKFGVPLIAMPMHIDQPLNAEFLVEIGVGLEIKRDKNGKIEREEVARVIRDLAGERTGEHLRKKARELSDCIRDKAGQEIDEVVNDLVHLVGRKRHNPF
uniref:anthocyanidin 3-O-glucosyltransferase n=1 Tax=Populus trichocarpa TaxID=3694 RepID=A0A2K1ZAJ3_POPTR